MPNYRTIVIIAGCLDLRISEILGLQWCDVEWNDLIIFIQRGVVQSRIYATKTEASRKPMSIDPTIAESLLNIRQASAYTNSGDLVFAGSRGRPRWNGIMLTDHIKPAALPAGIGNVCRHTFRHTFSSLLHQTGAKLAVQKELLRLADMHTTMNIYMPAVSEEKREAVQRVVRALLKA